MSARLEAGKVEISQLQQESSRVQTEVSRVQTEVFRLQAELSHLKTTNDSFSSLIRSLEVSNARMEEKLTSNIADLTRIRHDRNRLRSADTENSAAQKSNQQEVSRLRYQMEELAQSKHDLMMASISSGASGKAGETFNCMFSLRCSLELC